ncbi:hypothetical protein E4U21_000011 [Claviceps maximensis]|nr:hypothetical protein E4U21_000011 [Claviceps maximensis]
MGPPRTRAHFLAQRGRFQEGSMNDRASAVPPMQFMDPSERAALEKPLCWERQTGRYFGRRPQMELAVSMGGEATATATAMTIPTTTGAEDKRGSKMGILGQMWEGMRGKLRIRRDDTSKSRGGDDHDHDHDEKRCSFQDGKDRGPRPGDEHRPSRDEVLASYHQLVASGFFASHAIQSTRFGPPRPKTSHGHESAAPPQWPLTPAIPSASEALSGPLTPVQTCRSDEHEVCSPVSAASSRGTKRAAADSPRAERETAAAGNPQNEHSDDDNDAEDDATLAHRFLPKRLRKTASRDISLPKIRSAASRKHLRSAVAAARKSLSTSAAVAAAQYAARNDDDDDDDDDVDMDAVPEDQAQLTHAVLGSSPSCRKIKHPTRARTPKAGGGGDCAASSARVSAPVPVFGPAHMETSPLRVVPDANRGIPDVPALPAKFTYGEDRENGCPWRGLRRG